MDTRKPISHRVPRSNQNFPKPTRTQSIGIQTEGVINCFHLGMGDNELFLKPDGHITETVQENYENAIDYINYWNDKMSKLLLERYRNVGIEMGPKNMKFNFVNVCNFMAIFNLLSETTDSNKTQILENEATSKKNSTHSITKTDSSTDTNDEKSSIGSKLIDDDLNSSEEFENNVFVSRDIIHKKKEYANNLQMNAIENALPCWSTEYKRINKIQNNRKQIPDKVACNVSNNNYFRGNRMPQNGGSELKPIILDIRNSSNDKQNGPCALEILTRPSTGDKEQKSYNKDLNNRYQNIRNVPEIPSIPSSGYVQKEVVKNSNMTLLSISNESSSIASKINANGTPLIVKNMFNKGGNLIGQCKGFISKGNILQNILRNHSDCISETSSIILSDKEETTDDVNVYETSDGSKLTKNLNYTGDSSTSESRRSQHPLQLNERDLNSMDKKLISSMGLFTESGTMKPTIQKYLEKTHCKSEDARNKLFRTSRVSQVHFCNKNFDLKSCTSDSVLSDIAVSIESSDIKSDSEVSH